MARKTQEKRTLTRATWTAIAATCNRRYASARRDKAVILLMYRTGMRVSEVCNLRLSALDLKERTVTVPPEGKTGARVLGLPDSHDLMVALTDWLDVRDSVDASGKSPYLFCTRSGKPIDRVSVWRMLRRRAEKAGVKGTVHPHMARHSFAGEQLRRADEGVTIRDVQDMLGHSALATTFQYLRGMDGRAAEVMRMERG